MQTENDNIRCPSGHHINFSVATAPTIHGNKHIETHFSTASISFQQLHTITAEKRYASGIFHNGERSIVNCNAFSNSIVFDIDNTDTTTILTLSNARKITEDYTSLIVTTKSHQKEKNGIVADRFRIIILLDGVISVDVKEYPSYYLHIASLLGIEEYIDTSCKDAARMYQPNPNQEVYYSKIDFVLSEMQLRISFEEKKFLDNSKREVIVVDSTADYGGSKTDYLRSILQTESLLELLKYDEKFVDGNRNNYLYSVGRYLIDNHFSEIEVRDSLEWINSLKNSISLTELNSTIMRSLRI